MVKIHVFVILLGHKHDRKDENGLILLSFQGRCICRVYQNQKKSYGHLKRVEIGSKKVPILIKE
jgi:hypothetical protein